MKSKLEYREILTNSLTETLGVTVTWSDIVLSDYEYERETMFVTVTARDPKAGPFTGSARIFINRMRLDNDIFVHDYRANGDKRFGAPLWSFLDPPTKLTEVIALARELSEMDIDIDDFNPKFTVSTKGTVTSIQLTAKADSFYYYGTLTLSFTYPWAMEVRFIAEPTTDVVIPNNNTPPLDWMVDDNPITLPYTLTPGKHKIVIRGIHREENTELSLKALTPTEVTRVVAIRGDWSRLFADCTSLRKIGYQCMYGVGGDIVLDEFYAGCTALTELPNRLFGEGSSAYSIDGMFQGSGLRYVTGNASLKYGPFDGLELSSNTLHRVFADCNELLESRYPFWGMENWVRESDEVFARCPKMTWGEGFFGSLPYLMRAKNTYRDCISLIAPRETLSKCPELETLEYIWRGCTSLRGNYLGLGEALSLEVVIGLFQECASLGEYLYPVIPSAPKLRVYRDIYRDSGITRVFDTQTLNTTTTLEDISGCFAGCSKLTLVHNSWLQHPTALLKIDELFRGAGALPGLTSLSTWFAAATSLRSARYAFADSTYALPSSLAFTSTNLEDITGMFQNSALQTFPTGMTALVGPVAEAAYAFANTKLTTVPANVMAFTPTTNATLTGMFQGCQDLTSVDAAALSVVAKRVSAAYLLADCPKLTTLGSSAVRLEGQIDTVEGMFLNDVAFAGDSGSVHTQCVLRLRNMPMDPIVIKDMFNGCGALTGSIRALYYNYFGLYAYNSYRYPDNFVEICFLLSDYASYGRPWWTTAKLLSAVTGTLDVFTTSNIVKERSVDHIPLFVTYYNNLQSYTIAGLSEYDGKYGINASERSLAALLKGIFAVLGITVPKYAGWIAVRVWKPRSGVTNPSWIRPGTEQIVAMVFDRQFKPNEGITEFYQNDVYAFTVNAG